MARKEEKPGFFITKKEKTYRWVLGILFIVLIAMLGVFLLVVLVVSLESHIYLQNSFLSPIYNDQSRTLFFLMISFAFISIFIVQKFWHKKTFLSLLTANVKFRYSYFFIAFFITFFLSSLLFLVGLGVSEFFYDKKTHLDFTYNSRTYWIYLPFLIFFIPIQAASEEVFFRGYLNQFFYQCITSKLAVFILTSFLFVLAHLPNEEAKSQVYFYLLYIFSYGFFSCLLANRFNGLEVSIGVHTAFNIFVFTILGYRMADFPVTYLFQIDYNMTFIEILMSFLAFGLIYFILDFILNKFKVRDDKNTRPQPNG